MQVCGKHDVICSTASDIFSFGMTCCELWLGSPYTWSSTVTDEQALKRFAEATAEDYKEWVQQLPETIPASLRLCIARCLDMDPSQRPTTASDLVTIWETAVVPTPSTAIPPFFLSAEQLMERAMELVDYAPKVACVLLRHAAAKGLRHAQDEAAKLLDSGLVVSRDVDEAIRCLRLAAQDPRASASQTRLGSFLLATMDRQAEAIPYLEQAAASGEQEAMYLLARCHYLGKATCVCVCVCI